MPNANQILFVVIIAIIFTFTLLGAFILLNKINNRRRQLFDIEQRLQAQEQQLQIQLLANHTPIDVYQPAMVKQGHQIHHPPIVIMTPQKEKLPSTNQRRESLLNKLYGFRTASAPFSRPSAIRPPSFLPMKENYKLTMDPPAYQENEKH